MTSRISSSLSLRLLGLALAFVISTLAVQPGQAIGFCRAAGASVTTYYSDASHSTVVGRCSAGCCTPCECTGTVSSYWTTQRFYCTDVICPTAS
jgi:hypothetical protein